MFLFRTVNLNWRSTKFTLRGIHFDVALKYIPKLDYGPILISKNSKSMAKETLTPIGKITVMKKYYFVES